jgi:hypothetical protein
MYVCRHAGALVARRLGASGDQTDRHTYIHTYMQAGRQAGRQAERDQMPQATDTARQCAYIHVCECMYVRRNAA